MEPLSSPPAELYKCGADADAPRKAEGIVRATPSRSGNQRTRLRARTPAQTAGTPRSYRETSPLTDLHSQPRTILRGFVLRLLLGQGTGGHGMGLRPEDSNLTTRLPKKPGRFCPEKYPQPFTTDRLHPSKKTRGTPKARQVRTPRPAFKLGELATAVCRFQRRNRRLHHPALCFVSFALKGAEEQTDAFG
jgi:hypothetical protein